MSGPRVSVIVPTFDRAATLFEAVTSVLEQSFRDLEVIVVDDASRDESEAVLTGLASDGRVVVTRHDENLGAAAARNTGIASARGDLIAFLDSDDRWLPQALERLVEALERADPSVGVVYGAIARRTRFGVQWIPGPGTAPLNGDLSAALPAGNFVDLPATLMKREVIEAAGGFDPELRTLEDWELLLRVSRCTHFRFVDAVLVESAVTPGGVNSFSPATLSALDRIEARHRDRFAASGRAQAQLAYLRGCTHAALGDRAAMRDQLRLAAKRAPTAKYRLAHAAAQFGPRALDTTLAAVKVMTGLRRRRHRHGR